MLCKHCKKENDTDAKFCMGCGRIIEEDVKGPVDTYFAKQTRGCQLCGSLAQTRNAEFQQNIGLLVQREYSSVKGRFCKKCINREFKKRTLITFFFGWWGVISACVTPFILIENIINFVRTTGMTEEEIKK
ncbi:MAG: hypothetical protein Q8P26_03800 [Candidatus Levybacteria bacterium]|nr:hypothetical protein [Candidatus Levybacteria bacterium]